MSFQSVVLPNPLILRPVETVTVIGLIALSIVSLAPLFSLRRIDGECIDATALSRNGSPSFIILRVAQQNVSDLTVHHCCSRNRSLNATHELCELAFPRKSPSVLFLVGISGANLPASVCDPTAPPSFVGAFLPLCCCGRIRQTFSDDFSQGSPQIQACVAFASRSVSLNVPLPITDSI